MCAGGFQSGQVFSPKDTKVVNKRGYTLNFNEFIMYDTEQIKMKYLVKIK